jgi:hypothetical protein
MTEDMVNLCLLSGNKHVVLEVRLGLLVRISVGHDIIAFALVDNL